MLEHAFLNVITLKNVVADVIIHIYRDYCTELLATYIYIYKDFKSILKVIRKINTILMKK